MASGTLEDGSSKRFLMRDSVASASSNEIIRLA
jgi:hypothetical protein